MEQKTIQGNNTFRTNHRFITITIEEYDNLKIKEKIANDALTQLKLSLEDLRRGKVSRF